MTISTNIVAGWPTINGRIYTQNAIDNMVKSAESKKILLHKSSGIKVTFNDVCGVVKKININKGLVEAEIEVFDQSVGYMLSNKMASISPVGKGMVESNGIIMDYELQSFSVSLIEAGSEEDDAVEIICQVLQELSPSFNFVPRGNHRIFIEPIAGMTSQPIWLYYDPDKKNIILLEGAIYKKEVQRFDLHSPDSLPELVNKLRMYFKDTA